MSTQPFKWPQTDADEKRWPQSGRPGGADAWHDRLGPNDKKYELYERKVGDHLAKKLNRPEHAGNRVHMPDGYGLFVHNKLQADGKIREDVYLFGSRHTMKFRSPNEFLPHVDWLLDTTNVNDHSSCGCQYNKGSAAHAKRMAGMGGGAAKRPGSSSAKDGSKPKKPRAARAGSDSSEDDGPYGVPLERSIDLRSSRRFRRGELVWVKIDPIHPTPEGKAKGRPIITHWPVLCSRIEQKSRTEIYTPSSPQWATSAPSSSSSQQQNGSSSTTTNGESSKPPITTATRTIHYYLYHLRPLGFFDAADEITAVAEDMLPWLCGSELLGGEAGWAAIGEDTHAFIEAGVAKEVEAEKSLPADQRGTKTVDERWRAAGWVKRISFKLLPRDWPSACVRAGLAIKMGLSIAQSWSQTDAIAVIDPSQVSEDDRQAIAQQKKSIYQGLWWGGERIWLEDLVRLNKSRGELPLDQFPLSSTSKPDNCVFMKMKTIAIEVTEMDPTQDQAVAWRCWTYGDIYELVPESDTTTGLAPEARVEGQSIDIPIKETYLAPKGFKYKQINEPDVEVTSDVVDIAGRVYPDLLGATTQTHYVDPNASPTLDQRGRVKADKWATALTGVLAGAENYSYSEHWKEDLYAIVSTAHKSVERDTKQFYGDELRAGGIELREVPGASGAAAETDKPAFIKEPAAIEAWRQTLQEQSKPPSAQSKPSSAAGGDVFTAQPPATLAQAQAASSK